jgi:6-phosphofructokinase 2
MNPVLTLTMNPAIDVSAAVEHVFPNHKLRCDAPRHDAGGGGINVARVLRRLGSDPLALHCCGGPTGEILRDLLDAEHVRHRPIPVREWTRQSVTISERATGQQFRFVMPGPELSEDEWRAALEAARASLAPGAFVVASGSLPPGAPEDFYARVARMAREAGARMVLDTSGAALEAGAREGVFLLKPSLRELGHLVGGELEDEAGQERAARELVTSGRCEAVIVSLGAAGVLFASADGCERLRAPSVAVRSRVGAGDSMVAGVVFAIAQGQKLRDAVRLGIATGTAAVMNFGTELCHAVDVEKLLRRME